MFEKEKKLLKSFADLLDVIGGFGRDTQPSDINWSVGNIAGRKLLAPNSLESTDSTEPRKYVVYVSRSAWLFRLLRLAEKEIIAEEARQRNPKPTYQTESASDLYYSKREYESARQIGTAIKQCGIDVPEESVDEKTLVSVGILESIEKKYNCHAKISRREDLVDFRNFIENVAFRLVVPARKKIPPEVQKGRGGTGDGSRGRNTQKQSDRPEFSQDPSKKELADGKSHDRNTNKIFNKSSGSRGGVSDDRSPLPRPDLSRDQTLVILASSWHGIALVPIRPGESIQAAEYLLNDKSENEGGTRNIRGAETVAAFTCDEFQSPAREFSVAYLVEKSAKPTASDDSRDRKIFIVAESARAMIEIGVASRFFSHIVRPVGDRFDNNRPSNGTQAENHAKAAVVIGCGALRIRRWFGVPLGLLVLVWAFIGSTIIIAEASDVSSGQSMALPLGALGGVVVLTVILSALSYRFLVGVSFGSKRAFSSRLTRTVLKDQVETESDRSAMLRRLRAQLSARSVQFWTDLYQDHKVWSFAEHLVEKRLGIRKAERNITEALDNRIAASSDFKLDVVSYQRKQSRWLRILFAGALSAFVALEFMELITEWFGLHYGQSVYDLIGCVAQFEGSHAAGCGSSSLANSLAESKSFRVSSILAVFGAIGAVVVGTVVALGRKLDDNE